MVHRQRACENREPRAERTSQRREHKLEWSEKGSKGEMREEADEARTNEEGEGHIERDEILRCGEIKVET